MSKNKGNKGSKSKSFVPTVVEQPKIVVVTGQRFNNLKIAAFLFRDKNPDGDRTAVLLELGNGVRAKLPVAQFPSEYRSDRDALMAKLNVNDVFNHEVVVTGNPVIDGHYVSIDLSALQPVVEKRLAREATEATALADEVAALKAGTLLTGKVVKAIKFGLLVQVGRVTGLLGDRDQRSKRDRPQDLKVGDKVEVLVVEDAQIVGGEPRVRLSEEAVVEHKRKAALVAARASLAPGQTYAAKVVHNNGVGKGLVVSIDGVEAQLADADMIGAVVDGKTKAVTVPLRGSIQSVNHRLTVKVVSVGAVVVVSQTTSAIAAKEAAAAKAAAEAAAKEAAEASAKE